MLNPKQVIAKMDVWKYILIPTDIHFTYVIHRGLSWWWNEEMQLLIDQYGLIRKTNKDQFMIHFDNHNDVFYQVIRNVMVLQQQGLELDLFYNWYNNYANTKVC